MRRRLVLPVAGVLLLAEVTYRSVGRHDATSRYFWWHPSLWIPNLSTNRTQLAKTELKTSSCGDESILMSPSLHIIAGGQFTVRPRMTLRTRCLVTTR